MIINPQRSQVLAVKGRITEFIRQIDKLEKDTFLVFGNCVKGAYYATGLSIGPTNG